MTGCKKHVFLSKILCCVFCDTASFLNGKYIITFIGDSENVSLMTMRVYLTVLFAADWIMMRWVIHLPTFQPPVDGARSLASSPVRGFYRR